ncbi:galactose mutarotase-like isoform X2 [Venturia canescens]|nr:galactose mutarotase-like isoform X2 [Venturia canescens]
MGSSGNTVVTMKPWGMLDGKQVEMFTMKNSKNQEVELLNYGATIRSFRTPDKDGKIEDVVLGFDNIEEYLASENLCFGATIGRVANRIRNGRFTLDGVEYNTGKNRITYTLHGGMKGWGSKVWTAKIVDNTVVMTLFSPDGDEGFPGDATATAIFSLDDEGKFTLEMKANVTKASPINLTNHVYFNIAGHGKNATELYKQTVMINADRWTVVDEENIPIGELKSVANTVMDLRNPVVLGDVINKVPGGGYDNNFCLPNDNAEKKMTLVSKVKHPDSGRYLEIHSNQPGVQFYTALFLPEDGTPGLKGKDGQAYFRHGSMCLETQNYPDAVNHPNFPDSILRPGQEYHHTVTYKFGVEA